MLLERDLNIWSAAGGGARALAAVYEDGDLTTWFGPYNECDFMILHFLLAGAVPASVEFKFQWSLDGGATNKGDLGTAVGALAGAISYGDGTFQLTDVANGDHTAVVAVPRGIGFKIQCQRTLGAGATAVVKATVVAGGIGSLVAALAPGAGGGGGGDVNLTHIRGTATVLGGVAGLLGVAGPDAENAAVVGNPVLTGGRYDVAPRALNDGDIGALAVDATGALMVSGGGGGIVEGPDADDAPSTGDPVQIGAFADQVLSGVADADTVHLVTDLYRRLRVLPEGDTADDLAATALNPIKVGAVVDSVLAAAADADMVHLVTDLYRRLRVLPEGDTADDAAATALNPVKVGAVADDVLAAVADADMVHLVTDLYRRLRVIPEGGIADDAASDASNPLKVGAIADDAVALVADDDMVHLVTDLYRRLRVIPEGGIADDAAADASNPLKMGAVADDALAIVADADMVHLVTDRYRRLRVFPEGDVADNGVATGTHPVKIGAVADDVLAAVADDDISHLVTDLYRRLRVIPEGDVADDAASTALHPVKVGAVADETLALVADDDMVQLVTDLYRRLHVRPAGFSDLLDAQRVSTLNTIADDRDPEYQTWADDTNLAGPVTYNRPNANGQEIGNHTNLSFQVEIVDGTLTFEVSNDGNIWIDATLQLVNAATGGGVASYGGAGVTANYGLSWIKCPYKLGRFKWVTVDATNDLEIHAYTRAH